MNVNANQFGFMPTTEALFAVRRMQEKHRIKKKKLYMRFVDIDKAFNRVSKNVIGGDREERLTESDCRSGDEP